MRSGQKRELIKTSKFYWGSSVRGKGRGSNYNTVYRYIALKDRTSDIIIIKRGTSEYIIGERNNINLLYGS